MYKNTEKKRVRKKNWLFPNSFFSKNGFLEM